MADTETTGTPGASQDDAEARASGTPATSTDGGDAAAVDADEIRKLREIREKYLAEKDTLERTKHENELLRQHVDQLGRAYQPPTGTDPRMQRLAQIHQTVQERDPETLELISEYARATQEQIQRQQAEQRFYRELSSVPAEDQSEVERIARSENLWPSIARDRLLARRYENERNEIAEQRRKLQEDQQRRERNVVKTTASPAPPASTSTEISTDEYDQLIRDAENGNRDARKRLDDVDYGRVRIRSG